MASQLRQVFKKYPLIPNALVYGTMVVGAEFSQQTLNKRYFEKKEPPEPYDTGALARYAVIGTVINPNLLYFWYRWLDKAYVGTATKVVLKKLVLDQFLMTPPLLVTFYLSTIQKLLGTTDYNLGLIGFVNTVGYFLFKCFRRFRWLENYLPGTSLSVTLKKLFLHTLIPTPAFTVIFYVSMSVMEGKKDIFEECRQKFVPTFQTSCMFWLPAQLINFLVVPPVARVVYVGTCSFIWINVLCWIKRKSIVSSEEEQKQAL